MKRVSIALAVIASSLGGFAGLQAINKAPAAPPAPVAAAITCDLALDVPDPAKTKSGVVKLGTRSTLRKNQAVAAAPLQAIVADPYFPIPFKKTCAGGNPLDVEWQAWVGDKHIDDAWFLNTSKAQSSMLASDDPMGLRTWKGVNSSPEAGQVSFNQFQIDARLASRLKLGSWALQPDKKTWKVILFTEKYAYPKPANEDYGPYGNIPVTMQTACASAGPWTTLVARTSDAAGRFEFTVVPKEKCPATGKVYIRGAFADAPTIWGQAGYLVGDIGP